MSEKKGENRQRQVCYVRPIWKEESV